MEYAHLNIIGGFSAESEAKLDAQRTINMFVLATPGGKTKSALVPMPGKKKFVEFTVGTSIRKIYTYKGAASKDYIYAGVSNKLWRVDSNGNKTELGTLASATGYIGMAANDRQLIIVDGTNGYVYNTSTSTFSTISSPGFPNGAQDVICIDDWMVVNLKETNEFFVSGFGDAMSWDALDFARLTTRSEDNIVAIRELNRQLFIFGKLCTEVWFRNTQLGGFLVKDFPFARQNSMILPYGCAAPGSVATGYQRIFWLSTGENGIGSVMRTDGTSPMQVSTPAIKYAIQQLDVKSDATGILYEKHGHIFYELSFTNDNKTFIYDDTAGEWYEGKTLLGNRLVGSSITIFPRDDGEHYIGAYNSATIYELSEKYLDDDGESIKRERITGHFSDEFKRKIRISRLNLEVVAGVGIPNTSWEDAYVYMSVSKDGGYFYGNKKKVSMGKLGDRNHRCIWRSLGTARDWVFKFEVIGKGKVYILDAIVEYEVCGR